MAKGKGDGGQTLLITFLIGLCACLLGCMYVFSLTVARPQSTVTTNLDVTRYGSHFLHGQRTLRDMLLWPSMVKAAHTQSWDVPHPEWTTESRYLQDCWADPSWFRMYADPHCLMLWMRLLEHGTVVEIDNVLPVVSKEERDQGIKSKPQQNGGMRTYFEGIGQNLDIKGYWKPCRDYDLPTNNENFAAEIVAFHIDHLLAFYRTPAVVPRIFSWRQFEGLGREAMDTEAMEKLESVRSHCSRHSGSLIDGAMVGWSPKEIQLLSKYVNKKEKDEHFVKFHSLEEEEIETLKNTRFNISPARSTKEDINWVLENVSANIFAILTDNYARFGHNLFIQVQHTSAHQTEFGPFIFLDNDRSRWKYDIRKSKKSRVPSDPQNHPLAHFCKFPKDMAYRLLLIDSVKAEGISLGKLVYLSTSAYGPPPSGPIFTPEEGDILDKNVQYVVDIIKMCLQWNPVEEVLFDEPGRNLDSDFLHNVIMQNLHQQREESFFWLPQFLRNATDILPFLGGNNT